MKLVLEKLLVRSNDTDNLIIFFMMKIKYTILHTIIVAIIFISTFIFDTSQFFQNFFLVVFMSSVGVLVGHYLIIRKQIKPTSGKRKVMIILFVLAFLISGMLIRLTDEQVAFYVSYFVFLSLGLACIVYVLKT